MEGIGWEDYKPSSLDKNPDRVMVLYGNEIHRAKIPEYFSAENVEAINLYTRYKLFGFPFAGGWAEQPARVMDVIETLEAESAKREAKKPRHGKRTS